MKHRPIISGREYYEAREGLEDGVSDYELFERLRDDVDLQEFVMVVSERVLKRDSHSVKELVECTDSVVWGAVFRGRIVNRMPNVIRERFADELSERVREEVIKVYQYIDHENLESLSTENEVREYIKPIVVKLVPEEF